MPIATESGQPADTRGERRRWKWDTGRVSDAGLTARVRARIRRDLPDRHDDVQKVLESANSGNQDRERVVAAIILSANGDLRWLHQAVELSRLDWRDVLVNGGLAHEDWPQRLDAEFGKADGFPAS